jgi:acyl-CoA thioester hydrolase
MAETHENKQVTLRLNTPLEGTGHRPWNPDAPIPAPLNLHRTVVQPQWVDYNGHMSESCFLLVFGDSSDAFFRFAGIDEDYRDRLGFSLYTVETHIHNTREAALGEPLSLDLQVLDVDDKRVHIFHSMFHGETGDLLATGEQMLLHVDMKAGRSAPMPVWLMEHLRAIHLAHAALPRPSQAGASIGIRRKHA